jgi:hypothetical protein
MHQVAVCYPQGYDQCDLWNFYDLDYGRRLPCGNIGTFSCTTSRRRARVLSTLGLKASPLARLRFILRARALTMDGRSPSGTGLLRRRCRRCSRSGSIIYSWTP